MSLQSNPNHLPNEIQRSLAIDQPTNHPSRSRNSTSRLSFLGIARPTFS
jgi:hypothetical protein